MNQTIGPVKHPLTAGVAFALFMATCAAVADEPPTAVEWRELASGSSSAIDEATRNTIETEQAWRAWWRSHTANAFDNSQPEGMKPPPVDFQNEVVLVATLGMRSTGGHHIEFQGVKKHGHTLVATVRTVSPGPDDIVTRAITRPFAIIAVPKHDGEVVFREG